MHRSPVPAPTDQDEFCALSRSSPWRWDTLRFVLSWPAPADAAPRRPVRAWVRRPDGLRVEALDISKYHIVEVDFDEDLTRANEFVG